MRGTLVVERELEVRAQSVADLVDPALDGPLLQWRGNDDSRSDRLWRVTRKNRRARKSVFDIGQE